MAAFRTEASAHVGAWRNLASWPPGSPPGEHLRERQDELASICRALLSERKLDNDWIWLVWQTISAHLENDAIETLADTKGARVRNRELVQEAQSLMRRLKHGLRTAIRLHTRAQPMKWYDRHIQGDRIVGAAHRPYNRFPSFYARALRVIDADPALHPPVIPSRRGNPVKRRNAALRADLRALGISRERISAILWAANFSKRR